jgi:hypothetical protein
MLDVLEQTYAVANPRSPDYDPDVIRELDFQVKAYEAAGMPASRALERAVTLLFQDNPFSGAKREARAEPTRKTTDVAKNLAAKKRAIPSGGREVNDTPANRQLDARKLTDEQLKKLSKSEEDELLGNAFTPT